MDVFFQNIIGAQLFPHHMVQILTEISNNGGGGEEEKGEERAQLQLENFFEKYNHYDVIAIIRQKVSFVYIFFIPRSVFDYETNRIPFAS